MESSKYSLVLSSSHRPEFLKEHISRSGGIPSKGVRVFFSPTRKQTGNSLVQPFHHSTAHEVPLYCLQQHGNDFSQKEDTQITSQPFLEPRITESKVLLTSPESFCEVASEEKSTCLKENIAVSLLNCFLHHCYIFFYYVIYWLCPLETGGISRARNFPVAKTHLQARVNSDGASCVTNHLSLDFKAQPVCMLPHTQFVSFQDLVMSPNINILAPIEDFITFNSNMTLMYSSVPVEQEITYIMSDIANYDTEFDTYTFHFLIFAADAQKAAMMLVTIVININSSNQFTYTMNLYYQEHIFAPDTKLDMYGDLQSIPGKEVKAICFTILSIVNHHNGTKQDQVYQEDATDDDIGGHHQDFKHGGSRNRINFRFNISKLLPLLLSLFALLHAVSAAEPFFLQQDGKHADLYRGDLPCFNDTMWNAGCNSNCNTLGSIFQPIKPVNFELDKFCDSVEDCLHLQICGVRKSTAPKQSGYTQLDEDDNSSEDQYICVTSLYPCDAELLRILIRTVFSGNFETTGLSLFLRVSDKTDNRYGHDQTQEMIAINSRQTQVVEIFPIYKFSALCQPGLLTDVCLNTDKLRCLAKTIDSELTKKSFLLCYFTGDCETQCSCKAVEMNHYKIGLNQIDHTSGTESSTDADKYVTMLALLTVVIIMIVVSVFVITLCMLMGGEEEADQVLDHPLPQVPCEEEGIPKTVAPCFIVPDVRPLIQNSMIFHAATELEIGEQVLPSEQLLAQQTTDDSNYTDQEQPLCSPVEVKASEMPTMLVTGRLDHEKYHYAQD